MSKPLAWAALILACIWIMHNPATAAADIRQAAHAITTFLSGL